MAWTRCTERRPRTGRSAGRGGPCASTTTTITNASPNAPTWSRTTFTLPLAASQWSRTASRPPGSSGDDRASCATGHARCRCDQLNVVTPCLKGRALSIRRDAASTSTARPERAVCCSDRERARGRRTRRPVDDRSDRRRSKSTERTPPSYPRASWRAWIEPSRPCTADQQSRAARARSARSPPRPWRATSSLTRVR